MGKPVRHKNAAEPSRKPPMPPASDGATVEHRPITADLTTAPKVAVIIPTTGGIDIHLVNWVIQRAHSSPDFTVLFHLHKKGGYVEDMRQGVVQLFLNRKPEIDWLMFIDADTIPKRDALTCVARAEEAGAQIVAYPVPFHGDGPGVMSNIFVETEGGNYGPISWHALPWQQNDRLFKIAAAGLACVLIHRDVLVELIRRAEESQSEWAWPFRAIWKNGRMVLGEDLSFFLRASEAGIETYVDLYNPCKHRKLFMLTPNMACDDLPAVAPTEKRNFAAPYEVPTLPAETAKMKLKADAAE